VLAARGGRDARVAGVLSLSLSLFLPLFLFLSLSLSLIDDAINIIISIDCSGTRDFSNGEKPAF